jgi:hypothetical protein
MFESCCTRLKGILVVKIEHYFNNQNGTGENSFHNLETIINMLLELEPKLDETEEHAKHLLIVDPTFQIHFV